LLDRGDGPSAAALGSSSAPAHQDRRPSLRAVLWPLRGGRVRDPRVPLAGSALMLDAFKTNGASPPTKVWSFDENDREGLALLDDPELVKRFHSKTRPASDDPNACILWTGALYPKGYGHFYVTRGREVPAHRFAYALEY